MNELVRYSRREVVGVITVNNPPVNALNYEVRIGLLSALKSALEDDSTEVIVLTCDGKTFIAGADIREFETGLREPLWHTLVNHFDQSHKPVVAALFGAAYGGGLEVALGCHYRVGVPTLKCALPEVKLGIMPGAGGTQRLPRLIGVGESLEMITTGDPVEAHKALKMGLLNAIVHGDLLEEAVRFALDIKDRRPLPRALERSPSMEHADIFTKKMIHLTQTARGAEAPFRCMEAVRAATTLPIEVGLQREWDLFSECLTSPQSKAMQYLFFGERNAMRVPIVGGRSLSVSNIAVVGAGRHGAFLALLFAKSGFSVLLVDVCVDLLEKGLQKISKRYGLCYEDAKVFSERITPTTSLEMLENRDMVLFSNSAFAGSQNMLLSGFGDFISNRTILGISPENRRSLEPYITNLNPLQVIGIDFGALNSGNRLVEVFPFEKTASEVVAASMKVVKLLGKVGVVVHGRSLRSALMLALRKELGLLVLEGCSPYHLDKVLSDFGFENGPFYSDDHLGLDKLKVMFQGMLSELKDYSVLLNRLCQMGRLGAHTNAGYYLYEPNGIKATPDLQMDDLLVQLSRARGITRRIIQNDEILDRCLSSLYLEGRCLLNDNVAFRASDVDLVCCIGLGFPPHKGGPMYHFRGIGEKINKKQI